MLLSLAGSGWPSYSVNALTVSCLQMYRRRVDTVTTSNGLEIHQANRLEAVASAVNHVTGRSSFVPRRGGADEPLAKGGLNGGHRPPLPCELPMGGFPCEFGPETGR